MSYIISLAEAKDFLGVIHDSDDAKLTILLEGAEDEAMKFMDREDLVEWDSDVSSTDPIPPSIKTGVLLLLQASYQAQPSDIEILRKAAERILMPYRLNMGA